MQPASLKHVVRHMLPLRIFCHSRHICRNKTVFLFAQTRMMATAEARSLAASLQFEKAYVDGKWVAAKSGKTYTVVNPANNEVLGTAPDMDEKDAREAIEVAYRTFQTWRHTVAKERSKILRKWFELMMKNKDALATLLTLEMGKPLAESVGEIAYSSGFLEWFGEECKRTYGDVIPTPNSNKRVVVIKQPIGVAGLITPWNFPSAMITRKAGAAIAAGCTVVLRPAEDTPYSALALCKLAEEAGLPPGVLNVVTSDRGNAGAIGKELCENPLVEKISFTGSTAVGKILLSQSASTVKKLSLELGGNAPFIVFDSADVIGAVAGLMVSKFRNTGQTCVCTNRVLVQASIYDKFVKTLADAMESQLKTGNVLEKGVNLGPLINSKAVAKVEDLVKDAVSGGAKVVLGGARDDRGGNYYQSTLLSDVNSDMRIAKEEIFGPVATVIKFNTEEEAIRVANATSSGLAAYFYTSDINQAWRVSENLDYGMVGVNDGIVSAIESPFGGVKESGLGREGGKYGLEEYLEVKSITFGGIQQKM